MGQKIITHREGVGLGVMVGWGVSVGVGWGDV